MTLQNYVCAPFGTLEVRRTKSGANPFSFSFSFFFFFTNSFLIRAMDSSEKEGACSSSLILIGF